MSQNCVRIAKINSTPIKRMKKKFRRSPKVLSFKKALLKLENGRKVIVMGEHIDTLGEISGKSKVSNKY